MDNDLRPPQEGSSYRNETTLAGAVGVVTPRLVAAGFALLTGCAVYAPQPLEPLSILRELEQVALPTSGPDSQETPATASGDAVASKKITARQAAGWAVSHNPTLVALRAEVGIAEAELVRAGLLPDPVIGWDSMNVVAVQVIGQTPKTPEYVAGLGLSWQVPRPGEIDANVGTALARKEEVQQGVLAAEWRLVREVHRVFTEVVAARARLDLNVRSLDVVRRTANFFHEARGVGGATAIQENLAAIELAKLEQERVRLEGELLTSRQALNELLGLPPTAKVEPETPADPFAVVDTVIDPSQIVEQAVQRRPDLRQLLALYDAAEAELRLSIAQQWPQLAIGTGISLVLPVFSRFNRPAIEAAMARRERLAGAVRAAVHALRAESFEAVTTLRNATRQVRAFEETLVPRVRESLRLTDEAFREREVTLVEILAAQKQVLDVQTSYLEARILAARARILFDTVTGTVLPDALGAHEEEKR